MAVIIILPFTVVGFIVDLVFTVGSYDVDRGLSAGGHRVDLPLRGIVGSVIFIKMAVFALPLAES